MATTLSSYLSRQSVKPSFALFRRDVHIMGRIYGEGDIVMEKYSYMMPGKPSYPVPGEGRFNDEEKKLIEKKGLGYTQMIAESGYYLDTLCKQVKFKGEESLSDNMIGITYREGREILRGKQEILDYINDHSEFAITVYRVPKNLI